ncbi:MAG: hypothetical protein ACYC0V_20975 [Armatimonadota bacterium]
MEIECPRQFKYVSWFLGLLTVLSYVVGIAMMLYNTYISKTVPPDPYILIKLLGYVSMTYIILYMLVMLVRCKIWAIIIVSMYFIMDVSLILYGWLFTKGSFLDRIGNLFVDIIILVLLVSGYLEYRADTQFKPTTSDDVPTIFED